MPALPRSERNAEDVDTFADDHQADALRYMLAHVYQPFEHSGQNHRHPYLGANVLNGLKKSWYKQKKRTILAA